MFSKLKYYNSFGSICRVSPITISLTHSDTLPTEHYMPLTHSDTLPTEHYMPLTHSDTLPTEHYMPLTHSDTLPTEHYMPLTSNRTVCFLHTSVVRFIDDLSYRTTAPWRADENTENTLPGCHLFTGSLAPLTPYKLLARQSAA